MRGIRKVSCDRALEALREAPSISAAARALGCSRPLLYQRGKEDPRVAEALADCSARAARAPSRRRQKRRDAVQAALDATPPPAQIQPEPEPQPERTAQGPTAAHDGRHRERLHRAGLAQLARIAATDGAPWRDRVAAAKALVAATTPEDGGAPTARRADPPTEAADPPPTLTPEQVAARLRFRA